MARALSFSLGLGLVLLSLGVSKSETIKTCSGNNGALKFEAGKSYLFDYESIVKASAGLIQTKHSLKISGDVVLTALSECEFSLSLENAVVNPESSSEEFAIKLEKTVLRFVMQNGAVEEVSSDPAEVPWTVNLKKAVLSLVQNRAFIPDNQKLSDIETSVFGNCSTDVFKLDESNYHKKVRLNECSGGEGSKKVFQGVPYTLPLVMNKNILQFHASHLLCSQKLENSVLSEASCMSTYNLFHEALIETHATLKFKSIKERTISDEEIGKLVKVSSLIYDFTPVATVEMEKNAVETVRDLLKDTNGPSSKAEVYIELKKALEKISNFDQFDDVLQETNKRTFFNALSEVASDSGVEYMTRMIEKGEVDNATFISFCTNLPFSSRPGTKALVGMKDLVSKIGGVNKIEGGYPYSEKEKLRERKLSSDQLLLLGSSGLAYQYCKITNPSCSSTKEYFELVNEIAKFLNMNNEDEIYQAAALALGNLNALTPEAVSAIQSSLENANAPWSAIQALEAFRRDPCQPNLKDSARKVLSDKTRFNSDVRINAYLAMSRCLQKEDLETIQDVFKGTDESDISVSGFIGSHIKNLLGSLSPSKLDNKVILSQVTIPDSVPKVLDSWRASKFVEHSTFKEKQNYGFSLEATMIFHAADATPKFLSINGTIDIFGRSYNLIEMGISRRKQISTMQIDGDDVYPNWMGLLHAFRAKDSYLRVLGTTISIGMVDVHKAMHHAVNRFLIKKNGEIKINLDYPTSLLSEAISHPTVSGLPLTLAFDGVQVHSLQINGSTDEPSKDNEMSYCHLFRALMMFNTKLDILFNAAVDLKSSISVGANTPVNVGFQVEGKVDVKKRFGLEGQMDAVKHQTHGYKLTFPEQVIVKKSFLGDFKAFRELHGKNVELTTIVSDGTAISRKPFHAYACSALLLGLKSCSDVSWERGLLRHFEITLEKDDLGMTGFEIQLDSKWSDQIVQEQNTYGYSLEITATTPGSKLNREFRIKVNDTSVFTKMEEGVGHRRLIESSQTTYSVALVEDGQKYEADLFVNMNRVGGSASHLLFNNGFERAITLQYSTPKTHTPVKLLDLSTNMSKVDSGSVSISFGGPLEYFLGNMKYDFEYINQLDKSTGNSPIHAKATAQVKSNAIGNIIYSGELEMKEDQSSRLVYSLNYNERSYELTQTIVPTDLSPKYDPTDPDAKFQGMDVKYDYTAQYTESQGHSATFNSQFGMSIQSSGDTKTTLTAVVESSDLKDPMNLAFQSYTSPSSSWFDTSLKVNAFGLPQSDLNLSIGALNFTTSANIADQFRIDANSKMEMKKENELNTEIHIDITSNVPELINIKVDAAVTDDSNELRETTATQVKFRDAVVVSGSSSVLNRAQKSFSVKSETKMGEMVLNILDFNVQLAQDEFNGLSYAGFKDQTASGDVYTGSLNHTRATTPMSCTNILDAEFVTPKNKKPYLFTWKVIYDSSNQKNGPSVGKGSLLSEKNWSWASEKQDNNLQVVKEFTWSERSKFSIIELGFASNITFNGENLRQTELAITVSEINKTVSLDDAGFVKMTGFTQDKRFRNDIMTDTLYVIENRMNPHTQNQLNKVKLTQTDLSMPTPIPKSLLEGTVNRTLSFTGFTDFMWLETAKMDISGGEKKIEYIQKLTVHDKELNFFQDVRQEVNGIETETISTLELVVKVEEDDHKNKKLHLKSQNSHKPDCPMTNFNFALSK